MKLRHAPGRRDVADLGAFTSVQQIMVGRATMAVTLVMAPKSVTSR